MTFSEKYTNILLFAVVSICVPCQDCHKYALCLKAKIRKKCMCKILVSTVMPTKEGRKTFV